MWVKSLLLAAGALAVAGCAGNVTIPSPGLDHPANPQAAAAPLPPLPSVPDATAPTGGGMDHDSSMPGMDHGSMRGMEGMRGMPDTEHGAHEHGASTANRPGSEESVGRMVSKVGVSPAVAPTKDKAETNTGMNPGMSGMGRPHYGH